MPLHKALPMVLMRGWLRAKGDGVERALIAQFNEAEHQTYASLVATAWVPSEFVTKFYLLAAPLLYPNEPRPLRLVGADVAKENFKGVFRFVLRIVSVETLIEKTGMLWGSFHDEGQARVTREGTHAVRFEVRDYANFPEPIREATAGWIAQAIELTGAKDVRVTRTGFDGDGFAWMIHWR